LNANILKKELYTQKKSYQIMSSVDLTVMLMAVLVVAFGLSGIATFCFKNSTESKFIQGVCIVTVWFIGLICAFFFFKSL